MAIHYTPTPDRPTRTEREYVQGQRDAFLGGAVYFWATPNATVSDVKKRALKVYPLPARTRPVRVTLSDGSACQRDGDVYIWWPDKDAVIYTRFEKAAELLPSSGFKHGTPTADDFRQVARLLDGETEPVPEDEA